MCVGSGSRPILSIRFDTFEDFVEVAWSKRGVIQKPRTYRDALVNDMDF
jgi:hypothetical protein